MKTRRILTVLLAVAMFGGLLMGCGGSGKPEDTLRIYDGQFSEMWLIHRMVKLLVEEHTDLNVKIMDEMAGVQSYEEMKRGNADLMNSYDGTLLTTYLGMSPEDVPDGAVLYDFVNAEAAKDTENTVVLLDKLGINNTYILAVPQAIADEYNLETVSDLVLVADQLVFGAEHDFFIKKEGGKYDPLIEHYGLNFKGDPKQIDVNLKYSAITAGEFDVTVAYATDGQNKEAKLKLLEDDKKFFPEYNGAILVREDIFERFADKAPNLKEVLNMLGGLFTDEIMVELTYEVDISKRSADEVAKEFLQQQGLISR